MAPRKGRAGCPGGAPRTWGVSRPRPLAATPAKPPTPAPPRCPRGARSARSPHPRSVFRRRAARGGRGWFSCSAVSPYHPRSWSQKTPRGICSTLRQQPPLGLRLIYSSKLRVPWRTGAEKLLCSADKDLDARPPGASRSGGVPAPLCRFRGCWVRGPSADPDHVRLGPQTVPLSLPEPLQNPGKKYLA